MSKRSEAWLGLSRFLVSRRLDSSGNLHIPHSSEDCRGTRSPFLGPMTFSLFFSCLSGAPAGLPPWEPDKEPSLLSLAAPKMPEHGWDRGGSAWLRGQTSYLKQLPPLSFLDLSSYRQIVPFSFPLKQVFKLRKIHLPKSNSLTPLFSPP